MTQKLTLTPLQAKMRLDADGPFDMDGLSIEVNDDGSPVAYDDDGYFTLVANGAVGDEVTYDTTWEEVILSW